MNNLCPDCNVEMVMTEDDKIICDKCGKRAALFGPTGDGLFLVIWLNDWEQLAHYRDSGLLKMMDQ